MSAPEAVTRPAPDDAVPTIRLSTVVIIAVAMLAVVLGLVVFASPTRVSGRSMEPTLSSSDIIIVDKFSTLVRDPELGEIIVVRQNEEEIVKRVVATAGQSVGLADGFLTVDGVTYDEAWVDEASIDSTYFGPVIVPEGTVFVMGDNRGESIDSRYFGAFPLDDVRGIVRWRVWPFSSVNAG